MHGQAHAHFRDMVSQRSNAIGVKPGGAGFACGVSIAADPALSARNPSQERGPVNSLEINDTGISGLPHAPHALQVTGHRRSQRYDPMNSANELDEWRPSPINDPVELGVGESGTQSGNYGKSMHQVAEGTEPYGEKPVRAGSQHASLGAWPSKASRCAGDALRMRRDGVLRTRSSGCAYSLPS